VSELTTLAFGSLRAPGRLLFPMVSTRAKAHALGGAEHE
jgi:hypothetical protein